MSEIDDKHVKKMDITHASSLVIELYKKYYAEALIIGLIGAILTLATTILTGFYPGIGILLFIVLYLLALPLLSVVFILHIDKKETGQHVHWNSSLKQSISKFKKIFLLEIIMTIVTGVGFLLFVIPAIVWNVMFSQAWNFALFKHEGVKESLVSSRKITKGYRWPIFATYLQFYVPLYLLSFFASFYKKSSALYGLSAGFDVLWSIITVSLPVMIAYALWKLLHKSFESNI